MNIEPIPYQGHVLGWIFNGKDGTWIGRASKDGEVVFFSEERSDVEAINSLKRQIDASTPVVDPETVDLRYAAIRHYKDSSGENLELLITAAHVFGAKVDQIINRKEA